MGKLESFIEANKSLKKSNLVGAFVGATSGIGETTAYAFAKYITSPTIYIVGRNEEKGGQVVEKLKNINSSGKYYFVKSDVTLIKDCDSVSEMIKKNEDKVNLLFLSAGFLTTNGRVENKEGIDTKLSVNYYGRWRIVENLIPLLEKGAKADGEGRVVSVLAPGNEGKVELDDLGLKHKFSLLKANRHITEFNSLAVVRFARLYPDLSFTHIHPGIVNTGIMRELPWYIRGPSSLLMPFTTSTEDAGERFFYVSTNTAYATGSHILDAKDRDITAQAKAKGFLTQDLQDTVWKHTENTFDEALATYSK